MLHFLNPHRKSNTSIMIHDKTNWKCLAHHQHKVHPVLEIRNDKNGMPLS